ncbi:Mss4-like protein [Lipomyces arxii]|uniref:Mss4-like protein n=1 Tax=Lipomyces arxii TaxID=56418 RepID=UPI0034CEE601
MTKYHGKCDCGAVQFDAEIEDPSAAIICYCNACKVRYGAFCPVYQVPDDKFTLTSGADKIKSYTYTGDSGLPVPCSFCLVCGTNVFREPQFYTGKKVVIAGTLGEPWYNGELKPSMTVYENERLGWMSAGDLKSL